MKALNLLKRLSRIAAIPVAWCLAIGPSNAMVAEQNNTPAADPQSEMPLARMSVLQSLLGRDIIPDERTGTQSVSRPALSSWQVAGDASAPVGSPPPPPPP
jgi:hypothetical protein